MVFFALKPLVWYTYTYGCGLWFYIAKQVLLLTYNLCLWSKHSRTTSNEVRKYLKGPINKTQISNILVKHWLPGSRYQVHASICVRHFLNPTTYYTLFCIHLYTTGPFFVKYNRTEEIYDWKKKSFQISISFFLKQMRKIGLPGFTEHKQSFSMPEGCQYLIHLMKKMQKCDRNMIQNFKMSQLQHF